MSLPADGDDVRLSGEGDADIVLDGSIESWERYLATPFHRERPAA